MKFLEVYWVFFLTILANVYGYHYWPHQYRDLLLVHLDKMPRSLDSVLNIPKEKVPRSLESVFDNPKDNPDVKHVILRIGRRNSKTWDDLGFGVEDLIRNEQDGMQLRPGQLEKEDTAYLKEE